MFLFFNAPISADNAYQLLKGVKIAALTGSGHIGDLNDAL